AVTLQPDQHVRRAQRDHQVVAGQGEVPGLAAVPVEDGGNLVVPADLACRTLAELGALLGLDDYFGHGKAPRDRSVGLGRITRSPSPALAEGVTSAQPQQSSPPGLSARTAQVSPSNRLVTEPLLNTSWIARAIVGAIDSTVSLSNRFSSGIGRVLVTTTSLMGRSSNRPTAGPENTAWVAAAITFTAPCS